MTAADVRPAQVSTAADVTAVDPSARQSSLWNRLRRNRAAMWGLCGVALAIAIALAARALAPYDPTDQVLSDRLQGPSRAHWFGTDDLGRDVLSRTLVAVRTSLVAAATALAVALGVGLPVGLMAGMIRGVGAAVVQRCVEAVMSLPALLIALALGAAFGQDLTSGMIAVGFVFSVALIQVIRASTRLVMAEPFVEASLAAGLSAGTVVFRHVVPHVIRPLIVQFALLAAGAIEIEASLSFLGLGARAGEQVSLGGMIRSATPFLQSDVRLLVVPGAVVCALVLSWSLLADGLRDVLATGVDR